MPLGWIDFSKSDRNKVLSVLDMLSEPGTLDELGIAPIRDGFANLFFPGTSTIQTRAKYFFIVPYALKDMEYSKISKPSQVLSMFDSLERQCGERFLENGSDVEGIIGKRSLGQGRWVKRTPADIYWAGLRYYGFFTRPDLSLTEYIRAMCAFKNSKSALKSLGNSNDKAEETDSDDKDAGDDFKIQFWRIPTYRGSWMENLSIKLSSEEGECLKSRIIMSYPDSMMSFILKNDRTDLLECDNFMGLSSLIHVFPEQIQSDYWLARDFSSFLYVIRVIYNLIVSDGENYKAVSEWDLIRPKLSEYAGKVDLDGVFSRLQVLGNHRLCDFLRKMKTLMAGGDLEGMKTEIRRRERELKSSRAKTMHVGEIDHSEWYGGRYLDYRYGNAKVIMRDIFESEGLYAESK